MLTIPCLDRYISSKTDDRINWEQDRRINVTVTIVTFNYFKTYVILSDLVGLPQKILNYFFCCSYDSQTVSHLSRTFGVSHPVIFKSINLFIKDRYLAKDKKFFSRKKKLFVTDKGAAVVLGITFDKLQDYFEKLSSETHSAAAEQVRYFEKLKGILEILPCDLLSTRHSLHPCRRPTSSSSIVSTNMQPISRHKHTPIISKYLFHKLSTLQENKSPMVLW
jgi:hypothetical protein